MSWPRRCDRASLSCSLIFPEHRLPALASTNSPQAQKTLIQCPIPELGGFAAGRRGSTYCPVPTQAIRRGRERERGEGDATGNLREWIMRLNAGDSAHSDHTLSHLSSGHSAGRKQYEKLSVRPRPFDPIRRFMGIMTVHGFVAACILNSFALTCKPSRTACLTCL